MIPKSTGRIPSRQYTSQEIRDELLRFIEQKFYPGQPVAFAKDRPRLLKWVVFEFSTWLDRREVTLPSQRFLQILRDQVLMEAVRNGNTGAIDYRPGYLRHVVQQHLAHHGDEIYEEAKSIRTLADRALWATQRIAPAAPDPVRELASAARLLKSAKRPVKRPENDQLTLL